MNLVNIFFVIVLATVFYNSSLVSSEDGEIMSTLVKRCWNPECVKLISRPVIIETGDCK